jgi:hypothetical protein
MSGNRARTRVVANGCFFGTLALAGFALTAPAAGDRPAPARLEQEANTWVKRSPRADGPPSPGMGYEASLAYDPQARLVLRWGGHNQGGGGEQNAELWAFDPATGRWSLREPNAAPPGVCCAQQNVFDPVRRRFLRFAAFSGNHGWQWFREIYLGNSSVWAYDPAANVWRDRRPLPEPRTAPLRCASWDSDHQVVVLFGGEGSHEGTLVYDPHANTWTRRKPKRQPALRSGGNLAYDEAHKLHILFGVQFGNDPHTWAYDLRRNEWHDRKPARQPPTDRNDAVLAYDRAGRAVVAVVRVVDAAQDGAEVVRGHLETWAYDAGKNEWRPLKPPRQPDGFRNRRRILVAVPDQNVLLLENYVNSTDRIPGVDREQQVWTYRLAEAKPDPRPLPPPALRVTTSDRGAALEWRASPSPGVTGYRVYRGEGATPWRVELAPAGRTGKAQTRFDDRGLKPGTVCTYAVRAVGEDGRESADSVKVRAQPGVIEDGVVSVLSAREVRLSWTPPGEDIRGYHVERAAVEVFSEDQVRRLKKDTAPLAEPSVGAVKAIGAFRRLTREPVKGTLYTDTDLDLSRPHTVEGEPLYAGRLRPDQLDVRGQPYRYAVFAYRVRAVNALGVEGGPSPYWLTLPSAPQWLFAREEGTACRLKWQANPEPKLRGYRVYRMEGPKLNGPGQPVTRLTADPVAGTHFTDARAGKETRRYWVVAVDTLGQEGLPSAPAWHYRQYRRYYEPFVGPWHQ